MMIFEKGSLSSSWPVVMRGKPRYWSDAVKMAAWDVPEDKVPYMLEKMRRKAKDLGKPGEEIKEV